jgi:hypothetical protein
MTSFAVSALGKWFGNHPHALILMEQEKKFGGFMPDVYCFVTYIEQTAVKHIVLH